MVPDSTMPHEAPSKRKIGRPLLILAGVVAVAFALRLFHLGAQSLWYDEGYSVYLAGQGLARITAETAADIQPPLYYYLLHFWIQAFGNSEAAVRGLSVAFGLLTVPLLYRLGTCLFTRDVGLFAAAAAALSPLHIWYAQETRMYTLLVALTLLSALLLWLALHERAAAGRRYWWGAAAVALALALYTHYFAFFVLIFQIFYVLLGQHLRWHRIVWKEGVAALAGVLITYLPWLPYMLARYRHDASYWEGRLKLDEAVRKIGISFSTGESVVESTAQWLALGFGLVLLVSLAALVLLWRPAAEAPWQVAPHASPTMPSARTGRPAVTFLFLYLALPLVLLLSATYWTPKFNPRYAMIASPPFLLLISAGFVAFFQLQRVWSRAAAVLMASFVFGTMLYADYNIYFDVRFTKPDFRGAARWVEEHQGPNETVILSSGHAFPVFTYYYPRDNWHPLPEGRTLSTENTLTYDVARDLNRFLKDKEGVWLVLWQHEVVDPNGYLTLLLDRYVERRSVEASFYHVQVRHYRVPAGMRIPEEPQIEHPLDIDLGGRLRLLGLSLAENHTVFAYWKALQPLAEDYKISLRLRDADGHLWSRTDADRRLASPLYPTGRWRPDELVIGRYEMPVLPGTPPGTYDLGAVVYAEGAPQALDILDEHGAPQGKLVQLGEITLDRLTPASREEPGMVETPLVKWNDEIALIGLQQSDGQVQAGDQMRLNLFWEALGRIPTDYEVRFGWRQGHKLLVDQAFAPAGPFYPTSMWDGGEIVRGQYTLDVPLEVEEGEAEILVGLFAGDHASAPFNEWFPLTRVEIRPTERTFTVPEIQYRIDASFEDKIALLGVNLGSGQVRAGESIQITLYWQALKRMDTSYTVFLHLLDRDNTIHAQEDRIPAGGSRPTTGWVPSEIIEDSYRLQVDPKASPGGYQLEVGLYKADDPTFPRLTVLKDGEPEGNRVIVGEIEVLR